MKVIETELPGLLVFEPDVFRDHRGVFLETWNVQRYPSLPPFVQDNLSRSRKDVLRGLHYQHPMGQGKLITAVAGVVYDVAVDLRRGSPTFGRWWASTLSGDDHRQLYIPEGFAHGFLVRSEEAVVSYKCTAVYSAEHDRALRWDDPDLDIEWPVAQPLLSDKDRAAPTLAELDEAALPPYQEPNVSGR